jgi:chitinase
MTYDFAGPWTDKSGHHSQLWTPEYPHNDAARISCHSAVRYCTTHGVPAEKILLGIPCYGRSFLGARGPGQVFQGAAGEEGTFEYRDLPRAGATEHFDDDIGAAYCVSSEEGFVTYDNVASVKLKAAYAKQEKLGGLFYWTGAGDADARERSLVVAGYNTLHPWNEE